MTYRHKQTGLTGVIAWQTEHEVCINCPDLSWLGTTESFLRLWEPLSEPAQAG